jgi:hypothetical protein
LLINTLLAIERVRPLSRQQFFETKKSAAAMSTEPESTLSAIVLQNIEIARRSHRMLLARRADHAQRIINVNN